MYVRFSTDFSFIIAEGQLPPLHPPQVRGELRDWTDLPTAILHIYSFSFPRSARCAS